MRILGSVLAVAALCLLFAGSASATSTGWVTMSFNGVSPRDVNWVTTSMGTTLVGVYNHNLYLDESLHGDLVDREASRLIESMRPFQVGTNGTGAYAIAHTFCADFKQYVYGSVTRYDITTPEDAPVGGGNTPMGDAKAADLRKLWFNYSAYGLGTSDWGDTTNTPTDAEKNEQAAAFQAAVWEIIYETAAYNVTSGTFNVSATEEWAGLANTWLGSLGTVDPNIGLRILTNPGRQDFAIIVPGVGADPIPEPVTMAGLMLGIGGLVTYVRKRRTV